MTYRIDTKPGPESVRLEVHGRLDAAALEQLIRLPGIELVAESPFLARWLAALRGGGR
jgi:hypothetical protein